jgi:hypothetical protein
LGWRWWQLCRTSPSCRSGRRRWPHSRFWRWGGAVLRRLAPSTWPLAALVNCLFVIIGLSQLPSQPGWAVAWLLGPLLAAPGQLSWSPFRPRDAACFLSCGRPVVVEPRAHRAPIHGETRQFAGAEHVLWRGYSDGIRHWCFVGRPLQPTVEAERRAPPQARRSSDRAARARPLLNEDAVGHGCRAHSFSR